MAMSKKRKGKSRGEVHRSRTRAEIEAVRMKNKNQVLKVDIRCRLTQAEVRGRPLTEQAEMAFQLFGIAADRLAEFGFDQGIIAHTCADMAANLTRLDGSPPQVVRIDPRSIKEGDE